MSIWSTLFADNFTWTELLLYSFIGASFFLFLKWFFRDDAKEELLRRPMKVNVREKAEKRDYSLEELKKYNGSDAKKPLLMGIKGKVYDVSNGDSFYGPGGPYSTLIGRDASRALALHDFNVMESKIDDLDKSQMKDLDEWIDHYKIKYDVIGNLLSDKDASSSATTSANHNNSTTTE